MPLASNPVPVLLLVPGVLLLVAGLVQRLVAEPVGLVLLCPEPALRLPCAPLLVLVSFAPLREGMHLEAVLGLAGLWFLVGRAAQASVVGEVAGAVVLLVLVDLPGLRSA